LKKQNICLISLTINNGLIFDNRVRFKKVNA